MAAFPSITPSYGTRKTSNPSVRHVQFGDGYIQRTVFGLNQNLKVYNPSWKNISETDADTISDFLDARGGQESFDWTPPEESSSSKFLCQQWTKNMSTKGRATIQATFQEVAEP